MCSRRSTTVFCSLTGALSALLLVLGVGAAQADYHRGLDGQLHQFAWIVVGLAVLGFTATVLLLRGHGPTRLLALVALSVGLSSGWAISQMGHLRDVAHGCACEVD